MVIARIEELLQNNAMAPSMVARRKQITAHTTISQATSSPVSRCDPPQQRCSPSPFTTQENQP
jgi:hypothetical protein